MFLYKIALKTEVNVTRNGRCLHSLVVDIDKLMNIQSDVRYYTYLKIRQQETLLFSESLQK